MKSSMTLFGCGPKMALLSLPYIILSLAVMINYPDFLALEFLENSLMKFAGFILLGAGFAFWIYSAVYFIRNFKPGTLLTRGPFGICRNPIYSSIIVFIIPGLGMILQSGLILSIAVVLYIVFKISIHGEEIILRRIFKEDFENYERSVNLIFPFPLKIKTQVKSQNS